MAGGELNAPAAVGRAVRDAARVELGAISGRLGLLAALPVAGLLALGAAIGQPVGAVTSAAGAMLAGVAWRAGSGPGSTPVGTMTAAGSGLMLATLLGTLSGRWPWLHLAILLVLCLPAGLLTSLGRGGSIVGTQSVIAFVVFGRFPESVGPAFALAGLVGLGAATQTLLAALVARPPAWRRQRVAVAQAYERLAGQARAPAGSSLAVGAALDAAEAQLATPALLGDQDVGALLDLTEEGRRLRLAIAVLGTPVGAGEVVAPDAALARVAATLDAIASSVRDRHRPVPEVPPADPEGDLDPRIEVRLETLRGQLAAAARMAERARHGGWLRAHPSRGARSPLSPFGAIGSDLRRLRANATLASAAGRHAVRLTVVVAGTELLVQRVALPRAYWAVVAAATVLRPEFGATFTRGAERVGGTVAGVVIATLIAVGLRPDGWGVTAIVGVLAWGSFAVFPASFAAGMAGLTAMVVFLLHAVAPDSATVALDRGIDTAIGGAIGLTAYALWPTWSGTSVGRLLGAVAEADRAYLAAVLAGLRAGPGAATPRGEGALWNEGTLRPLARRARIAFSDAEAAVALARAEPLRGADPRLAAAILGGLRRLVYGIHALRIDGAAGGFGPQPALAPLAAGFDEEIGHVAEGLRSIADAPAAPPASGPAAAGETPARLRQAYRAAMAGLHPDVATAIGGPLDELVDATNSLTSTIGSRAP